MGAIVCAAPATARRVPSVTTGTRKTASRLGVVSGTGDGCRGAG